MARTFLIRGMICGIVAGLLVFFYARYFGEPAVDGAIGVEDALAKAAGEMPEMELVSRDLQSTWGLFTGVMLYSIALGGIFSLLSAYAWGRMGRLGARASAALLAGACFIVIYLAPFFKYPANPPSVGNPDTIQYRTAIYFGIMVISIAAAVAAINLARAFAGRLSTWHAALLGGAVYLVVMAIAYGVMPSINEVPEQFPAVLLWSFRTTSVGMQLLLWTVVGLLFGELTARSVEHPVRTAAVAR